MMTDTDWSGKVAIVTGGSSGIGEAAAMALAERGACVAITGRSRDRLDAVAARHDSIVPIQADSADPAAATHVVEKVLDRWDRLDLLVNNAGAGGLASIDDYGAAAISQMCAVNIVAPSLLLREASPALRRARGAVINIGSAVSRSAAPGLAHYAATKLALEHLTVSWAIELSPDRIRVNAISPGPVASGALTGMMGLSKEDALAVEAREASQVPLERRGVPSDIVPWILRLGSSTNEWLTGQVVTVDGGWSHRT